MYRKTTRFVVDTAWTALLWNIWVLSDGNAAARNVQSIVTDKAHQSRIRVAWVCAWNTSRLAFGGNGRISREGKRSSPGYSLCRFSNGKQYNCDLNASYNIVARYYIRERQDGRLRQKFQNWPIEVQVPYPC